MPIIGLTDRASIRPQLPVLGQLRKGGPKTENAMGREMPTFRFRSNRDDVMKAWEAAFPEPPESLVVYLPFAEWEENFPTCKEKWVASRLQHRCDGETTSIFYDEERKGYSQVPRPCPGGCKEIGRLSVIVPQLVMAGFRGTVTVVTHGKWDLSNIAGQLFEFQELANLQGTDLRGMEVLLYREYEEKPSPDGPRRGHHNIKLAMSREWMLRQIATAKAYALGQAEPMAFLEEGPVIDEDTGEILDESPREEVSGGHRSVSSVQAPDASTVSGKADAVSQAGTEAKPNGKPATVKTKEWATRAAALAARFTYYQKNGETDWYHLVGAAGKLGYAEITDENLTEVLTQLEVYAARDDPPF